MEGEQQNKVSFSTFYGHKARGKDTAQAASQPSSTPSPSSTSSSQSSDAITSMIVILIVIAVAGAVIAFVSNTLKKNQEQKYLDALGQQSIHASTLMPASPPVAFPSHAQAGPPPTQPGYSPAPQQYQPPYPQGPTSAPYLPPNHNGYGGY